MLDAITIVILLITQFMTWVYIYDLKKQLYEAIGKKEDNKK